MASSETQVGALVAAMIVGLIVSGACSGDVAHQQLDACGVGGGGCSSVAPHDSTNAATAYIRGVQEHAGAQYVARRQGGSFVFDNKLHRLTAVYSEESFVLKSAGLSRAEVTVDSLGCPGDLAPLPKGELRARGNRIEQEHGQMTAWYLNGPLGIEQGFDLPHAPSCASEGAAVRLVLAVSGLTPFATRAGDVVLRDAAGNTVLRVHGLFATDSGGSPVEAALSTDGNGVLIDVHAAPDMFPLHIDPLWSQQTVLMASDATAEAHFGFSVAIDGERAVVGAPFIGNHSESGSAYVFVRSGGVSWTEEAILVGSALPDDDLGGSVGISGDTIVVGAPDHTHQSFTDSGAVFVFVRDSGGWVEQAKLTPSDAFNAQALGASVSIDGDTVVAGAPGDDGFGYKSGAAYVFVRSGTAWTEQAKLRRPSPQSFDAFGSAVDISGDVVVVGSSPVGNRDQVYVFERSGATWTSSALPKPSGTRRFGGSLAVFDDTILVADTLDDDSGFSASGAAFVFERAGPSWTQTTKLYASTPSQSAYFGSGVDIEGTLAIVGAFGSERSHMFNKMPTWAEESLIPQQPSTGLFGAAVAMSNDTAIVGAYLDDDGGTDAGLAYIFVHGAGQGEACEADADCFHAFYCVDGVCCNSACGGDITADCLACTASQTGLPNGVCGTVVSAHTCRVGSGDACDPSETCDGAATTCPADYVAPPGTLCNPGSGDVCDADELCTGIVGDSCPADVVAPPTTVCNPGSGDICDPDETCTGIADEPCPVDFIEPSSTVCNAGSGDICDPDETCSGVADQPCPPDVVAPSDTLCNPGSGDLCDPDEMCPGTADEPCPADTVTPATTICRTGSGDLCDPNETCTGAADQPCPPNHVEPSSTVCNPGSGDICDPDETCTGVAGDVCPADVVAATTVVCRSGSGDVCDPNETCPGVAGQLCPADLVAPPATLCRAGSGDVCDPAETCTGTAGDSCPLDIVAPTTTTCRTGSGDICDPDEMCTGAAGQSCPPDIVSPSTTTCNVGSGDICDPDETCTGIVGAPCPLDSIAAATLSCRSGSGDLCDPDETCTGVADERCPADYVSPATTLCNPGSGDLCDPSEMCTGSAGDTCPSDTVTPSGTVCRLAVDACDAVETCNGSADMPCPPDVNQPAGFVCRPASGSCDAVEKCDGSSDACPVDGYLPAGDPGQPACSTYACDGSTADCAATCANHSDCAVDHFCDGASCAPQRGLGVSCDDENQCTSGHCTDGVCCDAVCDGLCEGCTQALTGDAEGSCGPIAAGLDPDEECQLGACVDGACARDDGEGCFAAADCLSGACVDATCCDTPCDGGCASCNEAGTEGVCTLRPQGTLCRPADTACDIGDVCDGSSAECPEASAPDGTSCDDGLGVCETGLCKPLGSVPEGGHGGAGDAGAGLSSTVPNTEPDGCACSAVGERRTRDLPWFAVLVGLGFLRLWRRLWLAGRFSHAAATSHCAARDCGRMQLRLGYIIPRDSASQKLASGNSPRAPTRGLSFLSPAHRIEQRDGDRGRARRRAHSHPHPPNTRPPFSSAPTEKLRETLRSGTTICHVEPSRPLGRPVRW